MELKGKKVLVFGAGKSGIGAADLLNAVGACPVLYDGKADLDKESVLHKISGNYELPIYAGELPKEVQEILNGETEDDDMDVTRFKELWGEMRKELQDNDASAYSAEAREWATKNGLIAGNGTTVNGEPNCMWGDILTREQFVTVLYRWTQMMGKA